MLTAGNPIAYSKLLLSRGKAHGILTGSLDEFHDELFSLIENASAGMKAPLYEGAGVVYLTCGENSESAYCSVEGSGISSLGQYPVLEKLDENAGALIEQALSQCVQDEIPEAVLMCDNGTPFDAAEAETVCRRFPNSIAVSGLKTMLGETLGASFALSICIGALCLKKGRLPKGLSRKEEKISSILVTGLDTAGNYMCMLLKR